MPIDQSSIKGRPLPQKFLNGEVHDWYRIVLGYSDHLVADLLKEFHLKPGHRVLDSFCGTGTTLVECMKERIESVGIDANPSSCFAAKVKTNWSLKEERLLELLESTKQRQKVYLRRTAIYKYDPTYIYLETAGLLERGWICEEPLRKAIAIKHSIANLRTNTAYKDVLTLALIAEVVGQSSNVKFGPELYCGPPKKDVEVFDGFEVRVKSIAKDLTVVSNIETTRPHIVQGDSRSVGTVLNGEGRRKFSAIICSPPYPTEHDYTRNARLELAFLEEVSDSCSLRAIKRGMIRSHTKGIYRGDADAELVESYRQIKSLCKLLDEKAANKTHGFARLYSTVVKQYFGGMKRHFNSVHPLLTKHAMCAYVVGDQSSYLQVHIPTAKLLSKIAEDAGFETIEIKHWRKRWSSITSKSIDENILILRKNREV